MHAGEGDALRLPVAGGERPAPALRHEAGQRRRATRGGSSRAAGGAKDRSTSAGVGEAHSAAGGPAAAAAGAAASAARGAEAAGSGPMGGCRGVGPWKLLACIGGLRMAGRMSANMVGSLTLQFLPIIAQRAHRKQEKLNRVGAQHRELLLPTLHRVLVQLDSFAEAESVKAPLEAFVSGRDTGKLGDGLSSLLKMLTAQSGRAEVAALVKGASEELLDLMPRLFPGCFGAMCPPMAVHAGSRCACCGADPIQGPRFHDAAASIDVCGECFIDHTFDASTKFDCFLYAGECADHSQTWQDGVKMWKDGIAVWQKLAGAWAAGSTDQGWGKGGWAPFCKGKGKMRSKGGGKGKHGGGWRGKYGGAGEGEGWGDQPWQPPMQWDTWASSEQWPSWGAGTSCSWDLGVAAAAPLDWVPGGGASMQQQQQGSGQQQQQQQSGGDT